MLFPGVALSDSEPALEQFTPAALAQQIKQEGIKQTASKLVQQQTSWEQFLKEIDTGQQEWVSLGLSFYRYLPGSKQIELRLAFEDSLNASPTSTVAAAEGNIGKLRLLCAASAYDDYDRAKNSDDERFNAVATVIATNHDQPTIDGKLIVLLNRCADLLDKESKKLDKEFAGQDEP